MMFNTKRGIALFLVAIMALSAVATPAAATVVAGGDWAGDGTDTITEFSADGELSSTVHFETDSTGETLDDIEGLELTVDYRNVTHVELDETDVEVVDSGTDGTDPMTVEFTVEHEDLETVPGSIDETVTVDVSVAELDADGEPITASEDEFTVDLEFTDERTVMLIDSDAVDDDDIGPTVDVTSHDDGWYFDARPDTYEIDDQRSINGDATTVEIHLHDSDAADAFGEVIEDEDLEDGDRIDEMRALGSNYEVHNVYLNEAGSDVSSSDSYAVYHESDDLVTIELGEDDYADRIAADTHVANDRPGVHDQIDRGDLQASGWGFLDAFWNAFQFPF